MHARDATHAGRSPSRPVTSCSALASPDVTERSKRERFLTRPMALALAIYSVFALTFAHFQITGDGLVYFNLLRRYFGEQPDFAFAYQFGSDLWNLPFFLVGKGLSEIFGATPNTFHVSFEEISITFATQAAFVLTLYLGWHLLRELDLAATPAVLFLTTFGSPLFYYVIFEPALKHAVDTLVMTAAALLILRVYTRGADRYALALGALVGVSLNIRYVNAAFFIAVACAFALHRQRALVLSAVTAALVAPAVFALPALRGISYYQPSYFPKTAIRHIALGAHPVLAGTSNPLNGFNPLIPVYMLFTDKRGLFVWTPLTAIAVIGYVLAMRKARDEPRRMFFWTLLAGALTLLVAHVTWAEWIGAFSFSTRFLTALFPFFLVGIGGLRRYWGARVYPILAICVAWSMLLAFVHVVGYDGIDAGQTATDMVRVYSRSPDAFQRKIDRRATERWRYLWALLHGEDPKHVNG